jgi:hypothetical protein
MVTFTPLQVFLKSPETCPIHHGLIPQGEHLTRRCSRWLPRHNDKAATALSLDLASRIMVVLDCGIEYLLAVVDNGQAMNNRQEIPWKLLLPSITFLRKDGKSSSLF